MKTKDKILIASLDAFSDEGVGQISTNHIADIMDISPGNLHYHFKSKAEIIAELLLCFTTDFNAFMKTESTTMSSKQSMWLKLTLSFQLMDKYSFIFKESSYILSKYPHLRRTFAKVMQATKNGIDSFCRILENKQIITIQGQDLVYLIDNLHLFFTQWPSYIAANSNQGSPTKVNLAEQHLYIKQGVNQALNLLYPYMNNEDKCLLVEIQQRA